MWILERRKQIPIICNWYNYIEKSKSMSKLLKLMSLVSSLGMSTWKSVAFYIPATTIRKYHLEGIPWRSGG